MIDKTLNLLHCDVRFMDQLDQEIMSFNHGHCASTAECLFSVALCPPVDIDNKKAHTLRVYRDTNTPLDFQNDERFVELGITKKEMGIVNSLINGKTIKEHSENTHRSYSTVRKQAHTLLKKVGVSSQVELLNFIYQEILIGIPGGLTPEPS